MCQFHLQRALPRDRALTEDVQDQPGAVDHLAGPGALQVALLYRRERGIDDRHGHVVFGDRMALERDLPLTQQGGGTSGAQRQDGSMHDDQSDRGGQPDGLRQACFGSARLLATDGTLAIRSIPRQDHRSTDRTGQTVPSGLAPRELVAVSCQRQGSSPVSGQRCLPPWPRRTAGSARPALQC